ncbi:MAG TPA: hypothetical protein DHU55_05675, partial [Blastocatellia bacterium]|nr:hypothetical protein [Blastocatellia bacterium]
FPESPRLVFTDQFIDYRVNQHRGVSGLEFEHVALRQQPVAKIDAFQEKWLTVRRGKIFASGRDESRLPIARYGSAEAQ